MTLTNLAARTLAAAFALSVFVSTPAHAAKIGVRVLDANSGLPVPNASVCLGTANNPTIYGTGVTSFAGLALYDNVPEKPILITVSKSNFRGIALQTFPKDDNVITDVLVTEGLSRDNSPVVLSKWRRRILISSVHKGTTHSLPSQYQP